MAATLGVLTHPSADSMPWKGRWAQAGPRLAARTSGSPWAFDEPGFRMECRHTDSAAVFEDQDYVIVLDGFVDTQGPHDTPAPHAHGAATVAEVLRHQGIEGLPSLTGSYAIAAWDRKRRQLLLIRDRFATKPMFYAAAQAGWCWGSEIKFLTPFLEHAEVDPQALPELIHYRWLAGQRTLVKGVRQVLPGHAVILESDQPPRAHRYYQMGNLPRDTESRWETWRDRTDAALRTYFARAAARFPRVAVLLSGGVDSSLLAAMASRAGFARCIAVTGRIEGFANPELPNAVRVATRLGMEHRIVEVTDAFLERALPGFVARIEYPHRNYTGLVMQCLVEAVANDVDAIVFGEGADSMFGCREAVQLEQFDAKQRRLRHVPWPLRLAAARVLRAFPGSLPGRVSSVLELDTDRAMQALDCVDYVTRPERVVPGVPRLPTFDPEALAAFDRPGEPLLERYQSLGIYSDCRCRLDLLDRLTEPLGLQVLSPFFAPELTNVAERLPAALMRRGMESKPVLRDVACTYFPREWVYEKKFGFPVPLGPWIEGPFAGWLADTKATRGAARLLVDPAELARLGAQVDPEMAWTVMTLDRAIRVVIDGSDSPEPS